MQNFVAKFALAQIWNLSLAFCFCMPLGIAITPLNTIGTPVSEASPPPDKPFSVWNMNRLLSCTLCAPGVGKFVTSKVVP